MKYKVKKSNEGKTLKKFLQEKFLISNSKIEKLINDKCIKINGKIEKYNFVLKINDEILIYKNLKERNNDLSFLKAKNDINIFFEDNNILIINKKEKELSQKSCWEKDNDLNSKIKKYLYEKGEWNPSMLFTPNLCHRIDYETKGLIIAAKNKNSMKEIMCGFKNKFITKIYICYVLGKMNKKNSEIKSWIEKDLSKTNKMKIKEIGKMNAICNYELIKNFNDFSIVKIFLQNGKKHQIRLQLKSIGNPILGDYKYNEIDNKNHNSLCLWSYEIKFNFPKNYLLSYLNEISFILNEKLF